MVIRYILSQKPHDTTEYLEYSNRPYIIKEEVYRHIFKMRSMLLQL